MTKKWNLYLIIMLILYGVALAVCLICDLALNGALTWFYIVLVSIMITFSITNLPFMLKQNKGVTAGIAVTLLTYLLLYVCCVYVKGDWLLSFAYPIASYSFVFCWVLFFIFKVLKINWGFKSAIALLLTSIFTITCNPLVLRLSGDDFSVIDMFVYDGGAANYSANGIIFFCLLACAVISAVIGLMIAFKKKEH